MQSNGAQTRAPTTHVSDDESTKKDIVDQLLEKQGLKPLVEVIVNEVIMQNANEMQSQLQNTVDKYKQQLTTDHRRDINRIKNSVMKEIEDRKTKSINELKEAEDNVIMKVTHLQDISESVETEVKRIAEKAIDTHTGSDGFNNSIRQICTDHIDDK